MFKTRYWKKWTSHCVNDPKDPITARKKSTASCCHIAGRMNLMREQGSACWRRWLMKLVSKFPCIFLIFRMSMSVHVVCTLHMHSTWSRKSVDTCTWMCYLCPVYLTKQNMQITIELWPSLGKRTLTLFRLYDETVYNPFIPVQTVHASV